MAVRLQNLKPYLSAVLLKRDKSEADGKTAADALTEIKAVIRGTKNGARTVIELAEPGGEHNGVSYAAVCYSERSSPAWLEEGHFTDIAHQFVLVAVRDGTVALICSDASIRRAILERIKSSIGALLGRATTESAFVGAEAKAIWLNGVHASTAVKPDSKFISGQALEYALDPLGDQTFAISAIRSRPAIAGLSSNSNREIVGAAPGASRIWIGRKPNWAAFAGQMRSIFDHIERPVNAADSYPFLAKHVLDLTEVENPYAVAILPSILLAEESSQDDGELEKAHRWAYETTVEVVASAGADVDATVMVSGTDLGTIEISLSMGPDGRITSTASWQGSKGDEIEKLRKEGLEFLTDIKQIKIFYDSGHTITDGGCFRMGWTDLPFDWNFEDFAGYNVHKEKPVVPRGQALADRIGGNKSLFCFVKEKLFPTGWLACDDGAMEIADFVHFDPSTNLITLVHIKGAGSAEVDRQVSVSDYEIVVSQGLKNLRHLDKRVLIASLEKGLGKSIARAVWEDGVRRTRTNFIAALQALPAAFPKCLLILQPRLTFTECLFCANGAPDAARALRLKQLNGLMLASRLSAMSVGADFIGVASNA
jgi:hypothetical protein